jgi:L-malate glycosyltransferase
LEKYAQKLNAQEWVHFSGWIPFHRISEAYLRSDIQVVSSLAEGTPRVVQEGLAHGLPLVCTRVGGCTRLLTHEKNALLVPPSDPKEIASAVQRIIVDGKLRRELIQNGYELARSFTSEELGSKLLEDVREMVNRKQ